LTWRLKMAVNVTPLHDRVLVRRLEEDWKRKRPRRAASSSPTRPRKSLKRPK